MTFYTRLSFLPAEACRERNITITTTNSGRENFPPRENVILTSRGNLQGVSPLGYQLLTELLLPQRRTDIWLLCSKKSSNTGNGVELIWLCVYIAPVGVRSPYASNLRRDGSQLTASDPLTPGVEKYQVKQPSREVSFHWHWNHCLVKI